MTWHTTRVTFWLGHFILRPMTIRSIRWL